MIIFRLYFQTAVIIAEMLSVGEEWVVLSCCGTESHIERFIGCWQLDELQNRDGADNTTIKNCIVFCLT